MKIDNQKPHLVKQHNEVRKFACKRKDRKEVAVENNVIIINVQSLLGFHVENGFQDKKKSSFYFRALETVQIKPSLFWRTNFVRLSFLM